MFKEFQILIIFNSKSDKVIAELILLGGRHVRKKKKI